MATRAKKLHWSLALTCFALSAVLACSAEAPNDMASERGGAGGGGDDVVAKMPGSSGAPSTTTRSGLPCDVDNVLKTRCQTCHAAETRYGASVPLVTHDDLAKAGAGGKKVYEMVAGRIKDAARPMPPSPNALLTAAESKTLEGWIAGGAKSSAEKCASDKPADDVKPLNCTPDTTLKGTSKYTMPQGVLDEYVCVGIDVNLNAKKHITALAPHLDNKTILHHILLFQSNKAESPTPTPCAAFGSAAWKLVAGWAPGGDNLELPPEAGIPEEKGVTHWVLQLHYNNAKNLAGQTDQSGYDLCTTDKLRANDAGVVAFGSTKFSIPPRSTTTIKCDYKLPATFKDVKLFNASPHMHTRGTAMSTERLAGGTGAPEVIHASPNFLFENQANFPIKKEVQPGDVMRTRCTWKNPTDAAMGFGEATGDEMCFDFLSYYPAIPDRTIFGLPLFTWITPSQSATCTTE